MPKFFFHFHDDLQAIDEEGGEFADLEAAICFATSNILELSAAEIIRTSALDMRHRIDIAGAEGNVLKTLRLSDVITITT